MAGSPAPSSAGGEGMEEASTGDGPSPNPLVRRVLEKLTLHGDGGGGDAQAFLIHRVHPSVRDGDPSAYEPQILSIGPFHHGNPKLRSMEQHKCRYLRRLLSRAAAGGGGGVDFDAALRECVETVRRSEQRIRRCYAEPLDDVDSQDLVSMMVFDGCFILELFLSYSSKRDASPEEETTTTTTSDQIHAVPWMSFLVLCDLLKLENQMPFFVLEDLFDAAGGAKLASSSLKHLAATFLSLTTLGDAEPFVAGAVEDKTVYHLLHVYFLNLEPPSPPPERGRPPQPPRTLTRCTIPCAAKLREAGIKLRRKEAKNFLGVTFGRRGVLEIPFLYVGEATGTVLRNLVALEQCCPALGHHFSIYVVFLSSLVNTARDVAVLEKYGIVENNLGGPEEMVALVNRLGKGMMIDNSRHYLEQVFDEVNAFCESSWNKNLAILVREYLGNPWKILSVAAAVILLALTLVQVVYSVLSYRKNSPT